MNPMQPSPRIIDAVVRTASLGPCAKSKRGAIVFKRNPERIYGNAHNSPPWPYECSKGDACRKDCGRICVHAEQRAILQMLAGDYEPRPPYVPNAHFGYELEIVHAKVIDGKLVGSKEPSCDQCSKLIIEACIQRVWLFDGASWNSWDAASFHKATLRNLSLHVNL